jgi:hypothetical protein
MRRRCLSPHHSDFALYGGRGIVVDPAWDSFVQFLADMGPRPSAKHTLERKDTNGPYSASNCVWATQKEQQNNRRNNRPLTLNGRTQNLRQWALEMGLLEDTIAMRLNRGWSVEKALTTPTIVSRIPFRYR